MTKATPQTTPMMQRTSQATVCNGRNRNVNEARRFRPQPPPSGNVTSFSLPNINRACISCTSMSGSVPREYAAMRIGERHLRKMIAVGGKMPVRSRGSGEGSCAHPSTSPSGTFSNSGRCVA